MNVNKEIFKGDFVRILDDEGKVKNLQDGHGGYNEKMKHYLGKVGQVIKVDSDGDLYVKFGRRWFVYNPMCCLPAPGEEVYEKSTDDDDSENITLNQSALNDALMNMMMARGLAEAVSTPALFVAIIQNNISMVRKALTDSPGSVNTLHQGLTPLCMASNTGYHEIVLELLKEGADIDKVDKVGNTPLIASVVGGKPEIGKLLIERGGNVNIVNNNGRTALHIAAAANYSSLMEMIISKGCDVNLQDSDGDTALHDAIATGSKDAVAVLCKITDPGIVNKRAFNILHYAALKGQAIAVGKILDEHKSLVNVKRPDGFTALHIAAANNHTDCAKLLIEKGNADVNSKNLNGFTPLLLAAIEGYLESVQLLIGKNADVNAVDGQKNGPLHACCTTSRGGTQQLLASMMGISVSSGVDNKIKVAKCLIENGAKTDLKNVNGETPLECCTDEDMKRSLADFLRQRQGGGSTRSPDSGATNVPDFVGLPCRQCLRNPACITLLPCGHKCVCRDCALQGNRCPVCEQFILQRVAISGGNPEENVECCVQ